jgi:hypothetical protein
VSNGRADALGSKVKGNKMILEGIIFSRDSPIQHLYSRTRRSDASRQRPAPLIYYQLISSDSDILPPSIVLESNRNMLGLNFGERTGSPIQKFVLANALFHGCATSMIGFRNIVIISSGSNHLSLQIL